MQIKHGSEIDAREREWNCRECNKTITSSNDMWMIATKEPPFQYVRMFLCDKCFKRLAGVMANYADKARK